MLIDGFPWFFKRYEIQELANRVEAKARDLNGLPVSSPPEQQDIIETLQVTYALLVRLSEQRAQRREEPMLLVDEHANMIQEQATQETIQPVSASTTASNSVTLSATVKELIKLSDWVLLAKTGATSIQPEVVEEIYRQLTAVLAKEGITLLDLQGPCNYELQMVVGTQPTDDPTQNDYVYSTVRPGYLLQEQLVRPQEVIVYAS